MKSKYLWIMLLSMALLSCKKFLDVKPKGLVIPEKMIDYERLLNSREMTGTFPVNILRFTDDFYDGSFGELDASPDANGYYWRRQLTVDEKNDPDVWGPLYNRIYHANVIINGVLKSTDAPEAEKKRVYGEALVHRATYYLDLLTVFAKAYNPASAATDPGMPMPVGTDVTGKAPARSSVKETLESMITDLKAAAEVLPLTNINSTRINKYVAYGVLSRVYLYIADFTNAEKYTELALEAPHTFLDYNNYGSTYEVPPYELSPEVLWYRMGVDAEGPDYMLYSDDLKTYFNANDLRFEFLTAISNAGLQRGGFLTFYNFGITFPELYLTKAELLARKGKTADAMALINTIRKNRFNIPDPGLTAANPEDALQKVLAERRREMAYSGMRWFDMKRLDQEGRIPEIKRVNKETGKVEAILAPHSPNYTFEIPIRVLKFNPGMVKNHP
ncbi:tetratricopeptide (TPR) repeat protein [Pedobacter africanus]|uniref:Tetratricopeptide (TPR) repeat protein n=1 Tax=Pedobacter africanus TaxID=151894 RepID=A0ACC6L028_9SPHI|nr:RagB/SusD family nutrient uptake outer membrane protein [Pedobacter africanus]MDR6784842.1 tetratricopeptide (TPR) repeat protein [Pedobacter africanus]